MLPLVRLLTAALLCSTGMAVRRRWSMSKIKYPDVKPIAVVFPQYHPIPENDEFWGKGFTEWTMLRPTPRMVDDITILRRPHEDIGYYNLLDYEHRRYMRVMADHFGVYGFNFYHYWFKDHPVMYRPVQQMILDGEPNKPFMFTWANEPWSKRWDGNRDSILLDQEYGDEADNVKHFLYLLKFFKHENYIKIQGKPVFVFYRIDHADTVNIGAIVKLWQRLAQENGLPGLYFMRFFGPFDNSVRVPGVDGYIQFEPVLSWVRKGGGPSIFPNATFDKEIFLANNPDLRSNPDIVDAYMLANPSDKLFRTSQFKVYDKKRTWTEIENKKFQGYENVVRGTFINWNNAPRRNFTNRRFDNYPHMVDPPHVSGFQRHLQNVLRTVHEENVLGMKLFQLTAWNEWNEQSVFEPNDIDGYDALQAIKTVTRRHTGRTVVHVGHKSGGIFKYISDLSTLFDHYEHIFPEPGTDGASYPPPFANCSLLHVHSAMVGPGALQWRVLDYARSFMRAGVPVFVTVHDYQFLHPGAPAPTLEYLLANPPREEDVDNTFHLLLLCQRIIFPSTFIKQYYLEQLGRQHHGLLFQRILDATVVTPHCDMIPNHDYLSLPASENNEIHVAYASQFTNSKGSDLFITVADEFKSFASAAGDTYTIKYHVFGDVHSSYRIENFPDITFHGSVKGDKLLRSALRREKAHILMLPNLTPEGFGYSLTQGVNTGLAVVYLNRGAFIDRLDSSKFEKYFPAATPYGMTAAMRRAAEFVVHNMGMKSKCCIRTLQVQPTKWYIDNYPVVAPAKGSRTASA